MVDEILHIGTSGYLYDDWLGNFYPQFCPKQDFLQFYSSKFKVVELDCTFHKIPEETDIQKWNRCTPDNFLFTAKFPKEITYECNPVIRSEKTALFIERMRGLGDKLGVLLVQFPHCFKSDKVSYLLKFLESLPDDIHFAIELRHEEWLQQKELFKTLESKNIAFCHLDHPLMPKVDIQTADFSYFRFLGNRKEIETDFSHDRCCCFQRLSYWKEVIEQRLSQKNNCFAFFNNPYSGHSPTTALKFKSQF